MNNHYRLIIVLGILLQTFIFTNHYSTDKGDQQASLLSTFKNIFWAAPTTFVPDDLDTPLTSEEEQRLAIIRENNIKKRERLGQLRKAEFLREEVELDALLARPKINVDINIVKEGPTLEGSREWYGVETSKVIVYAPMATLPDLRPREDRAKLARSYAKLGEEVLYKYCPDKFGCAIPSGSQKVLIRLHGSSAGYAKQTGRKTDSPGDTVYNIQTGQAVVDINLTHPLVTTSYEDIAPHEITHAFLSLVFKEKELPRWADEGLGVLSESTKTVIFRMAGAKKEKLLTAEQIMKSQHRNYYSQSPLLIKYMSEVVDRKGGYAKFINFLSSSLTVGYDKALREFYQMDFRKLNVDFKKWEDNYLRSIK